MMKRTNRKASKERYKLLKHDHIKVKGRTLYRIKALVDINDDVKKGDIGGYIENKFNLDIYDGESWVYKGSKVYGDVYIAGNTKVIKSVIYNTEYENFIIRNAYIARSMIKNSMINCNYDTRIYDSDLVNCSIQSQVSVIDKTMAVVIANSKMSECTICPRIYKKDTTPKTFVYNSNLFSMDIPVGSFIMGSRDIISFSGFGSKFRSTFASLDKYDVPIVECGCFIGTINEFEEAINNSYETGYWNNDEKERCRCEYKAIAQAIKIHFHKDGDIIKLRDFNRNKLIHDESPIYEIWQYFMHEEEYNKMEELYNGTSGEN